MPLTTLPPTTSDAMPLTLRSRTTHQDSHGYVLVAIGWSATGVPRSYRLIRPRGRRSRFLLALAKVLRSQVQAGPVGADDQQAA
jgi:hypothetical protein